jgi:6-phosphofructokinase 2
MPAIITITLNPAIDKSTTVPVLVPEKKMRCSPPVFEPGGGGINVARAIKKLGGNATAIYFAGGYTGRFFTELLSKEGVDSLIIETAKHTRENLIVVDNAANLQYRFGMPGPVIEAQEWQQLLRSVEKINDAGFIIASGSVPAGVPLDIFARIAVIAKKIKAKFILDTSGEALQHAADEGVYLLKPNLNELSSLVGVEEISTNRIDHLAKEIIAKGNCEVVVVSMGAAGAMLVTKDMVQQINAPVVKRKSTVGAGDSMVAGIVLSLLKGIPITAAVKYGVACGTAATMNAGTELCRKGDADKLFLQL